MAGYQINEKQVEEDLDMLGKIRSIAWQRNPETLLALIERLQVKLVVEDLPRRQRQVYRAVIDYFESVLEERIEKDEKTDREKVRRTARDYVRAFLKSFDE